MFIGLVIGIFLKQLAFGFLFIAVGLLLATVLTKAVTGSASKKLALSVAYIVVYIGVLLGSNLAFSTEVHAEDGVFFSFYLVLGLLGFLWIFRKEIRKQTRNPGISSAEVVVAAVIIFAALAVATVYEQRTAEYERFQKSQRGTEYALCTTRCPAKARAAQDETGSAAEYNRVNRECRADCISKYGSQ